MRLEWEEVVLEVLMDEKTYDSWKENRVKMK
jgi:hypothetical protein